MPPQTLDLPLIDDSEVFSASAPAPQTLALPFIDGGVVFAPTLIPADAPTRTVRIGSTTIDGAFAVTFQYELADIGSFSFSLQRDDPDRASITYDQIVRIDLDGFTLFSGIIKEIDDNAIDPGGKARQVVTFSGPGSLAIVADAVVKPSRGPGSLPIEEVRSFSWPAPDFDDSGWGFAKKINRQRQYAYFGGAFVGDGGPVPWIWPDTEAWWIWANRSDCTSVDAPGGTCFFRKTITLAAAATVRTFWAFDNGGTAYIDGAEVASFTGFVEGQYVEIDLSAGTHVIAAKVSNAEHEGYNPGGFIATAYTLTPTGLLSEQVWTTDATWKCLPYPDKAPGFTHGQVLRILIEEAQADDAFPTLDLDFTDDLDTDGQPWSEYREVSVRTGRSYLEVLREMSDAFIDVAMAPGALKLRAWAHGGRGQTRAVTLNQTTDPATSEFQSLRHRGRATRLNRAFVRYAGGTFERVDQDSIDDHGSKGGYLELGAINGLPEARRITDRMIDTRATAAVSTTGVLVPSGDATRPGSRWWVGDTITCRDEDDGTSLMRVRSLTYQEGPTGVVTWPFEFRDEVLEIEERHQAWLRRMADGALGGGARVSSQAGRPIPSARQIAFLKVAEFSTHNIDEPLPEGFGIERPADASGNMVEIVGEITLADDDVPTSTATTFYVYMNGVILGGLVTIPAGVKQGEIPLTILPVRANLDVLRPQIVSAGTGAEGLDIQVRAI